MSISTLAGRRITVLRKTALLVGPTPALATLAVAHQPPRAAHLEVRVEGGAANTGTVALAGSLDGVAHAETLTFAGEASQVTAGRFDALASVTTTGLPAEVPRPTVQVLAVAADGSRLHQVYEVVAGWPARMDRGRAWWPSPAQGSTRTEPTLFYLDWTDVWAPQEGDVFVDDRTSDQWAVESPPDLMDGQGTLVPHHWEVRVRLLQGVVPG